MANKKMWVWVVVVVVVLLALVYWMMGRDAVETTDDTMIPADTQVVQ